MTHNILLLDSALRDIDDAYYFYESKYSGLDTRFISDVNRRFEDVAINPKLFPVFKGSYRKAIVGAFPYIVYYRIIVDIIHVMAVLHQARSPDYSSGRMES